MYPFDPPQNIRKPLVFLCFKEDQKGTLGRNGLKSFFVRGIKLNELFKVEIRSENRVIENATYPVQNCIFCTFFS